jgi:hypothetical protein
VAAVIAATPPRVWGIDHAINPRSVCHDPMLPRDFWKWEIGLAVFYYLVSLFLAWKATRAVPR